MEKLIKIQSIINQIEDLEEMNKKIRSRFEYINENHLEIETYCTDKAIGYYKTLDDGKGYTIFIQDSKLTIYEF